MSRVPDNALSSNSSEDSEVSWRQGLTTDGFVVFRKIYASDEVQSVSSQLDADLQSAVEATDTVADSAVSIRSKAGVIYAARNLIDVFPSSRTLWDRPRLRAALSEVLGEGCGLVRGLYFDKPPDQSWSLPWHRDQTIAVADNQLPTTYFRNPTKKEGVLHVEAPRELLQQMLTMRIHLDDVTEANGPLMVLPGSHGNESMDAENATSQHARAVLASAGDVLLMRPLLSHCSGKSFPDCISHRRVVHLEFASRRELPDGYAWHHFLPIDPPTRMAL